MNINELQVIYVFDVSMYDKFITSEIGVPNTLVFKFMRENTGAFQVGVYPVWEGDRSD